MSQLNNKTKKQKKQQIKNKEEIKTIHTTISDKTNELLEKYAKLKDENQKIIFGNKKKVIEKALELLDKYYNPNKNDLKTIWNRARNELNMILVGKATFLAYISGDYEKAFKENIATDIIEWYKKKHIEELSLDELLESIKNIWLAANYFYKIDIEVGSKGTYQMSFYHDFHKKRFSDFWGKYFNELISHQKDCEIETFVRNESLVLRITPSKK